MYKIFLHAIIFEKLILIISYMSLKRVKDEYNWWPRGWGLGLTRLYYAEHFGFDTSPSSPC